MDKGAILALIGGAALLFLARTAQASTAPGSPGTLFMPWVDTNTPPAANNPASATLDAKTAAFLATIRQLESGNRYNVLNGGQTFSDYSHHPARIGKGGSSTAAGAYQIVIGTWQQFGSDLPDFTPNSQDICAYRILNSTGAIDALDANDESGAVYLASSQWESLTNQSRALAAYDTNLATG